MDNQSIHTRHLMQTLFSSFNKTCARSANYVYVCPHIQIVYVSGQILPHRFFCKSAYSTNDLQAQWSAFYRNCPVAVSEALSKAPTKANLRKEKLRTLNHKQLFQSISHRIGYILMETNNLLCQTLFSFLNYIVHKSARLFFS